MRRAGGLCSRRAFQNDAPAMQSRSAWRADLTQEAGGSTSSAEVGVTAVRARHHQDVTSRLPLGSPRRETGRWPVPQKPRTSVPGRPELGRLQAAPGLGQLTSRLDLISPAWRGHALAAGILGNVALLLSSPEPHEKRGADAGSPSHPAPRSAGRTQGGLRSWHERAGDHRLTPAHPGPSPASRPALGRA